MIRVSWPPSELRGHAKGHWRGKANATKAVRQQAHWATLAAETPPLPAEGDIHLVVTLTPPSNRGDRTNDIIACKAILDGVADGLKVNDRRFNVTWQHTAPKAPGCVTIAIGERRGEAVSIGELAAGIVDRIGEQIAGKAAA